MNQRKEQNKNNTPTLTKVSQNSKNILSSLPTLPKMKEMTKSTHNIESAKTKNALLNITDSPNILPTHDLKHLLQYIARVGNLPQHIDNASTLKNELAVDVKGFIKMYAVKTEGGFVFPSSYEGLFMDFLNRYRLETLDGGLERRSGGIKKSRTGESSGEKVRALFLDFILFAFIFTDI